MGKSVVTASVSSSNQNKVVDSRETLCSQLYVLLRPSVKHWVYASHVSSWSGQQEDIVDDILQETLLKILIYLLRAEQGEVAQIEDIEHFALTVAHNYCRDLQRKDQRLDRYEMYVRTPLEHAVNSTAVDPSEIATDQVYQAWLFLKLADFVVTISTRQRIALLHDLAKRMHFGQTPTPLQQAFADKGLDLKQHQGWEGASQREYSQHASNLTNSYKKIEEWSRGATLQ